MSKNKVKDQTTAMTIAKLKAGHFARHKMLKKKLAWYQTFADYVQEIDYKTYEYAIEATNSQ